MSKRGVSRTNHNSIWTLVQFYEGEGEDSGGEFSFCCSQKLNVTFSLVVYAHQIKTKYLLCICMWMMRPFVWWFAFMNSLAPSEGCVCVYACVFAYLQDMLWRCIMIHSRIQLRHRLLKLFSEAGFTRSAPDWLDTSYKAIHLLLRDYWGRTALQKIIRLDTKLSTHPHHSSCDTLMTALNSWAHFLNDAAAAENMWQYSCFHRWAPFTPLMSHLLPPPTLSFIQPLHVLTFYLFSLSIHKIAPLLAPCCLSQACTATTTPASSRGLATLHPPPHSPPSWAVNYYNESCAKSVAV